MNVVSGESRLAISVLYRVCQPILEEDDLVKHENHEISRSQEGGLSAKPGEFPAHNLKQVCGLIKGLRPLGWLKFGKLTQRDTQVWTRQCRVVRMCSYYTRT